MVDGIMQEEEELEPVDAGGYRSYIVFLESPSVEELEKFIKGDGEDDMDAVH